MLLEIAGAAAAGVALLAAAAASYAGALSAGADAWWMRGRAGRAATMALLDLLFTLGAGAFAGRRADARMAAAAAVRVRALATAPPPPGAVVFVGSSTFTFWGALAADMRGAGVVGPACVNAAYGGSTTGQLLAARMDAVCAALAPACIVYFCGTNDVNLRREGAAANFAEFAARLRAAAPRVRFVYLAPTLTPFVAARRGGAYYAARFRDEAGRARAVCAATPGCEYVASAPFQAEAGSYLGDGHHLTPAGHALLAAHLAPAVLRALAAATADDATAGAAAADDVVPPGDARGRGDSGRRRAAPR